MEFNDKGYLIINGDFRDLISSIPDESIDCVVTDPPYPVISGGTPENKDVQRPSGILSKNDGKIFKENNFDIQDWINEIYRVMKMDTHLYIMINFTNLSHYLIEVEKAGFSIHNLLVWEKNNATPNRWYMKNCEYIIFARKGAAKPINDCGTKTVMKFNNVKDKIHPTQKPVDLLTTLIVNSTQENDIVFDPFGGSFSTVVAGITSKRRVISFELDEEFYKNGLEWIEQLDEKSFSAPVLKEKRITPNQEIILNILKQYPDRDFSGADLAELTGLTPRTCSGCITPLVSSGLAIKVNNKSPFRIKLKI